MADIPPKTRRRYLPFSLRAMLLLVLVIGASLGWTLHKVREQGVAVAALENAGWWFQYAQHVPPRVPLTVLERLRMWCGEKEPRNVVMAFGPDSQVTDVGLAHLGRLTQLQLIVLDKTQITDAGLVHLESLTQLQWLAVTETQVTDAGLAHLERLTQLARLNLRGTQVTDGGLIHLGRLTQLEWLNLDGTQITDAGLVHLERLTQLEELELIETQVTDAGVEKLQKALPNLKIER